MICERPFTQNGMAHPCGGCLPCRHQRARVWAHRIVLEATQHEYSSFITLTYTDEKVLQNDGSLNPRDVTLFLKRLRKAGQKVRYFLVGEYGPATLRPHYHLALFGFRTCDRGQTDLRRQRCCTQCDIISRAWGNGAIQCARLEPASAAYIAGYVTKKLTAPPIPKHLYPEYTRMSLRPGLGHDAMYDVAHVLMHHEYDFEDVPVALQHGQKKSPLGRYLRKKLRKMVGRDEKCPETVLDKIKEELQPLRQVAFQNSTSLKKELLEKNKTKRLSFLQRKHIHRQGRSL